MPCSNALCDAVQWQECRNTFYNPKRDVNVLFEILNSAAAPFRKTSHMSPRHGCDGEVETTDQTGNRNTVSHSGTLLATITENTGVPLATEPGISFIILTPMKILQRNLNGSTFVV